MASFWKTLQSTALGAGSGFLVGGPYGALIGGGLGLASGLLSSDNPYQRLGSPRDVVNVNPYTREYYNISKQNLENYNQLMKQYLGKSEAAEGDLRRIMNQMGSYTFEVSYDPLAAQRAFLSTAPSYQPLVDQLLQTQQGADYARTLSAEAARQVASQFAGQGGLQSGAALKAMMEGATLPLAQYQSQREAARNQALLQLLGQGYAGLQRGYELAPHLELQRQQAQFGVLGSQADIANRLLGYGMAGQQLYGGLGQGALSAMGGVSTPQWWQPTYVANPNYRSPLDAIGLGLSGGNLANAGGLTGLNLLSQWMTPSPKQAPVGPSPIPNSDYIYEGMLPYKYPGYIHEGTI